MTGEISSLNIMLLGIILIAGFLIIYPSLDAAVEARQNKISIKDSITLSAGYIKNSTLENGRFVYKRDIKSPDKKYKDDQYNTIRHGGTLYSMLTYERLMNDDFLKKERIKASIYYRDNYIIPAPQISKTVYVAVSKPEEEHFNFPGPQAKLGAAGMALTSLSPLYSEDLIELDVLKGLGEFILFMQKSEGNFSYIYDLNAKKKNPQFKVRFYPGEAALGLLYLYEVDPQEKWLNASKKALLYRAKNRQNLGDDIIFDHWCMLATEKLFSIENNGLYPAEKKLLQSHCIQNANSIMPKQILDKKHKYYGNFEGGFGPCDIGTIMEGMAAIYNSIDDEQTKEKIMKSMKAGNEFLSNTQIKKGSLKGGLPMHENWQDSDAAPNASIIRIDTVQHVLAGWVAYQHIIDKEK